MGRIARPRSHAGRVSSKGNQEVWSISANPPTLVEVPLEARQGQRRRDAASPRSASRRTRPGARPPRSWAGWIGGRSPAGSPGCTPLPGAASAGHSPSCPTSKPRAPADSLTRRRTGRAARRSPCSPRLGSGLVRPSGARRTRPPLLGLGGGETRGRSPRRSSATREAPPWSPRPAQRVGNHDREGGLERQVALLEVDGEDQQLALRAGRSRRRAGRRSGRAPGPGPSARGT